MVFIGVSVEIVWVVVESARLTNGKLVEKPTSKSVKKRKDRKALFMGFGFDKVLNTLEVRLAIDLLLNGLIILGK